MNITPLDMQDGTSHWNGIPIVDEATLTRLLDDSQQREPFLLELAGGNGFKLTIGIGGPLGCVQFSSNDGEPPYLVAVANAEQTANYREVEFLAGGTATPVPVRWLLPFAAVKKLVVYFFEKGDRSLDVQWEEV